MSITDQKLTTVAQVDVRSAWFSKINWTQAVGIAASALVFLTGGKVNIPVDVQIQIVTGVQVVTGIATWIQRTWFTTTITPSSAKEIVK